MIEKKTIKKNLEEISFPRIYGSKAEKKAYNIIKSKIEKLGLNPSTQKFEFTRFYSIYYPKIMFLLIFWLFVIFYLNIGNLFQDINLIILISLFLFFYLITRYPDKIKIGKKFSSQNLHTEIAVDIDRNLQKLKRKVILLAHIDSKSQKYNVVNRVRSYIFWAYTALILVIFLVFKNLIFTNYELFFYLLTAFPLGLHFVAVLFILNNKNENKSQGALDNASGVVILLALMKYFLKEKLKSMDLQFVFTGAEECGTNGVRNFFNSLNIKNVDKNRFTILNFDCIGTDLDFIKHGLDSHKKYQYQKIFHQKAKNYGLLINERNVPFGSHSDGYFFFKQGFKGIEFGDWKSYRYVHSEQDTLDKVNPHLLKLACRIVIDSLRAIDKIEGKN
ncbi:MAG: M28 family peptidase [Candidatus Lokiarchaeota archaeon]|nr:M28 family peptidase [Candidatus Lokiarchaeota archaeon]MBD3340343.1 M28 family peptidase [Candidatus Lokiarchaeota archaeon]